MADPDEAAPATPAPPAARPVVEVLGVFTRLGLTSFGGPIAHLGLMQAELVRLARRNPRTVMFITHSVEEAVYLADRVVVMGKKPGRLLEIMDIKAHRTAEGWEAMPIEQVMDLLTFVHLRSRIWKLLKSKEAGGAGDH